MRKVMEVMRRRIMVLMRRMVELIVVVEIMRRTANIYVVHTDSRLCVKCFTYMNSFKSCNTLMRLRCS